MDELVSITVTAGTAGELAGIARLLVTERLVACANIVPTVRSIYRWEGVLHDESEALAVLHTRRALVDQVFVRIRALHSYQSPQLVALPILDADPAYAEWVRTSTTDVAPE